MEKKSNPLLILLRIICVGLLWSVFFFEGIRVILITNWHFDILRSAHWEYAWNLWMSGWIIDDSKEWAFVLIILSFIPLWITGWASLSLIPFEKYIRRIIAMPFVIIKNLLGKQVLLIKKTTKKTQYAKKKSYKEVRPRSSGMPIEEKTESVKHTVASAKPSAAPRPAPSKPAAPVVKKAEPVDTKNFEHSLFKFDEEDDFELNFDAFDDKPAKKPEPAAAKSAPAPIPAKENKPANKKPAGNGKNPSAAKPNNKQTGNSILDIITQSGYEVITGATVKNNFIDFIGVSDTAICIFLCDKEPGDWLADEERFNNEEPLWFSETSHRISPVRKVDIARQAVKAKLADNNLQFDIKAYVIVQLGNIINAEDMFETWNELDISVTRIDRGTPKELKLFSKSLDEVSDSISKDKFEKVKKLIRSI